jgi:glycosyltransferase involved in cell wall biosynthesis
LRVAINAQLLSFKDDYRQAGVSNYIYQLVNNVPRLDPQNQYFAYLNTSSGAETVKADNLTPIATHLPTSRPPFRILWEQTLFPLSLRSRQADLVHCPMHVLPFLSRRRRKVVTIHDLAFMTFPGSHKRWNRLYLRLFTRWSLGQADRVIAVSESTRREIVRLFGMPRRMIDVVYNGVDERFAPQPAAAVERFRREKGLPSRFILYLGTLEPRKNVEALLRAYAAARKTLPQDVKLVVAGGKGWGYEPVFETAEKLDLGDTLQFPGFVPDDELPLWYSAAEIFVYPSLYEGFGLPPLEAMACGTPVIASNSTSLPEVVGDAGILVSPHDDDALRDAILRVAGDQSLREEMSRKGIERAAMFSWVETAIKTIRVYHAAMST